MTGDRRDPPYPSCLLAACVFPFISLACMPGFPVSVLYMCHSSLAVSCVFYVSHGMSSMSPDPVSLMSPKFSMTSRSVSTMVECMDMI